jgi:hypothetical protein
MTLLAPQFEQHLLALVRLEQRLCWHRRWTNRRCCINWQVGWQTWVCSNDQHSALQHLSRKRSH